MNIGDVWIDPALVQFVAREAAPGTGIDADAFWRGFAQIVRDFAPRNAALLARRDRLQSRIDAWHRAHPGPGFDPEAYRRFLEEIGYLEPEAPPCTVSTDDVDAEIATLAGPQLVVPVNNARYAINAANARWGSLYDALYGSDVLGAAPTGAAAYDPRRGARVIAFARDFLDAHFPLRVGSHAAARGYAIENGALAVRLDDGTTAMLRDPSALRGHRGDRKSPDAVLLAHHGLHVEIQIDRHHVIGGSDPAGVSDLLLEAALTTIHDCEDSVAAVNAAEKIDVYRHWLGLMRGDLTARFERGGETRLRRLAADREYQSPAGERFSLPGRSLLLVRNVGHHLLTDSVTLAGEPTPETLLDLALTALIGMHDLRGPAAGRNSRRGSIYVVKPKLHGSEEVAFAAESFAAVERLLGLPAYTLKMGVMDEERRTTVNLAQVIRTVARRLVFINTGFLDRTGDEIHTSMEAGVVARKADLRNAGWLRAYEDWNVDVGLACGLSGRAQIGKGMWALPDRMAEMLRTKAAHPQAGANTAWVPSPTAATLHALHYHQVDVAAVQAALRAGPPRARLADILRPPLLEHPSLDAAQIEDEILNNVQSILGYVVRWIEFGIGCSKVPDFHDLALMEDRATLRISSQLLANWLHHGVCTRAQVLDALERMARVVDRQNADDPRYRPMSSDTARNVAFQAACDLIFLGREQPNGYTEAILHARRREYLASTPV